MGLTQLARIMAVHRELWRQYHLMHWVRQGSRLVETQIYIGEEWIINQMDREIAAGLVYLNCFDGMNQLHELVAKCEFP